MNEIEESLNGQQIAKLLRTDGPTVSCVLLRAAMPNNNTSSMSLPPSSSSSTATSSAVSTSSSSSSFSKDDSNDTNKLEKQDSQPKRVILTNQISEIMVDTTPKKSMVSQILGGPFTFLGQFEDEGTMVMIRQQPENENEMPGDNDELVLNPHELQPPLHDAKVYGDILLMRVAPCNDDNEEEEEKQHTETDLESNKICTTAAASAVGEAGSHENEIEKDNESVNNTALLSNDEFFLNYTKEEYIKFASRTDIVAMAPIVEEEEEEEENDDEDEEGDEGSEDDEYQPSWAGGDDDGEEDDDDDDDCQISMMNLILAQIIKRFREENERGPNTQELLTMKSALAEKLGIVEALEDGDVVPDDSARAEEEKQAEDGNGIDDKKNSGNDGSNPPPQDDISNDDDGNGKRKLDEDDNRESRKRVKFTDKNDIRLIPAIQIKDDEEIEPEEGEI